MNWNRVIEVAIIAAIFIVFVALGATYIKQHSTFVAIVTAGVWVAGVYVGAVLMKWYYTYVLKK